MREEERSYSKKREDILFSRGQGDRRYSTRRKGLERLLKSFKGNLQQAQSRGAHQPALNGCNELLSVTKQAPGRGEGGLSRKRLGVET